MINKNKYHIKICLLILLTIILSFFKYKRIKVAIYYSTLKNGGAQRVTALLINTIFIYFIRLIVYL